MKYLLWLAFRQLLPSLCEFRVHVPDTCLFLGTHPLITWETVVQLLIIHSWRCSCWQHVSSYFHAVAAANVKTGAGLWRARCGVQTPRAQSVPCLKARGGWDRLPAVWLGIIHNSRVKVGLLRAQLSVSLELKSRQGFPCGSAGKESACNAGDPGLIPGLERSPGEGKGYSLQYSDLENSMDCMGSQRVGHNQESRYSLRVRVLLFNALS